MKRSHFHVKPSRKNRKTHCKTIFVKFNAAISWQLRGLHDNYGGLRGCYGICIAHNGRLPRTPHKRNVDPVITMYTL